MKNSRYIFAAACLFLVMLPAGAEELRLYTHTSVSGDTLTGLAKRYLLNPGDVGIFQKFNAIKDPNRISIGTPIKIPASAMRTDTAPAEIVSTQGTVASSAGSVALGSKVSEGDKLSTGDGGFVTIKLADGSTLTVQPKSTVRMETARKLANSGGVTDTVVRLDSGRVETSVAKQKNSGGRYEIRTPTSNMGVRGTLFRVGADDTGKRGQSEVVEGLVAVAASVPAGTPAPSNAQALPIKAGFGTFVEAGKAPSPPIALLAAPELKMLAAQLQTVDARFAFPAIPAAVSYRAQVATDSAFTKPLANASATTPEVGFVDLPDGNFYLRVRGVDVNGLEGKDATHAFAVKARPQAPVLATPGEKSRVASGRVAFKWQAAPDAVAYRVQVAADASFAKPVVDEQVATSVTLSPASVLKPAAYFWRAASVNAKGDTGPWSQTLSFTSAADAPVISARQSGGKMSLEIEGSAAPSHQIQIARDERFTKIVSDRVITGNKPDIGELPVNVYYVRVRAGVVGEQVAGPWSEARYLEVYAFGGGWWLSMPLAPMTAPVPAGK